MHRRSRKASEVTVVMLALWGAGCVASTAPCASGGSTREGGRTTGVDGGSNDGTCSDQEGVVVGNPWVPASSGAGSSRGGVVSSSTSTRPPSSSLWAGHDPITGCPLESPLSSWPPTRALAVSPTSAVLGAPYNITLTRDATLGFRDPVPVRGGVVGALTLPTAGFVIGRTGEIEWPDGSSTALAGSSSPQRMTLSGSSLLLPMQTGVLRLVSAVAVPEYTAFGAVACLPPEVAVLGDDVVVARPELGFAHVWRGGRWTELPPHQVYSSFVGLDPAFWSPAPPRRVLLSLPGQVMEVASLGRAAGFLVHRADGSTAPRPLPLASYRMGATRGHDGYVVGERDGQTVITTILADGATVTEVERTPGVPIGVAIDGATLFVLDQAAGIRMYALGPDGVPTFTGRYQP